RPLLQRIGGLEPQIITHSQLIKARLSRNVPSAQGREDYVRVRILRDETGYTAAPVFGKSGLISTMTKADGLIKIDMNTEGLDKDSLVDVYLF
ncbi:MAG: molybdopterin molybdenumtransferase MoeA, partial [Deltaproteobacteria bacterium]|nr:molybdopterin molybdenumtransferase MoeA [Deltaproteobacteria bacterium]